MVNSINKVFELFDETNKILDGQVLEISVKMHQITISMKDTMIDMNYIFSLLFKLFEKKFPFGVNVSVNKDILYLTIPIESDMKNMTDFFSDFINIINEMEKEICSCPSLEYVVADSYVKCFLDKPGTKINDLKTYEKILGAEDIGELELHPQRPYLLFIRGDFYVDEGRDMS